MSVLVRRSLWSARRAVRTGTTWRWIATNVSWHADSVRWRLDLDDPARPLEARRLDASPLDVRRGTLEGLRAYRDRHAAELVPAELCVDEAEGVSWFYVGVVGDDIATIAWIYGPGDPNRFVRLDAGEVEIKSVYTFARHRGRRLFSALLRAVLLDLDRHGIRRVYAHVARENDASWRAFARAGFRPDGVVTFRKVLGVPRVTYRRRDRAA